MAETRDDSVELLKDDAQTDDEKNESGNWSIELLTMCAQYHANIAGPLLL